MASGSVLALRAGLGHALAVPAREDVQQRLLHLGAEALGAPGDRRRDAAVRGHRVGGGAPAGSPPAPPPAAPAAAVLRSVSDPAAASSPISGRPREVGAAGVGAETRSRRRTAPRARRSRRCSRPTPASRRSRRPRAPPRLNAGVARRARARSGIGAARAPAAGRARGPSPATRAAISSARRRRIAAQTGCTWVTSSSPIRAWTRNEGGSLVSGISSRREVERRLDIRRRAGDDAAAAERGRDVRWTCPATTRLTWGEPPTARPTRRGRPAGADLVEPGQPDVGRRVVHRDDRRRARSSARRSESPPTSSAPSSRP